MRPFTAPVLAVAVVALLASVAPRSASAAEIPTDRIVAVYFHRTERCPTCQKMGSYAEEAVKRGFPERVNSGTVAFHYVDFQDRRNAALAKGYGVSGPALIVARVAGSRVLQYANLKDIWTKVADKPAFLKYVRQAVTAYDPPADRVVAIYFHRTERCPTCRKMGSYAEEAVAGGFARQVKDGKVGFYYVDFQDPKNAALAKRYKVSGPALVVARVKDNKVAEFQSLSDIWTKVADKKAFLSYVKQGVAAYHEADPPEKQPAKEPRTVAGRGR